MEGTMFEQFGTAACHDTGDRHTRDRPDLIANPVQLDGRAALELIGKSRSMAANAEIYAQGDASDCWYQVVAGVVRRSKLLADGRRHIAEFCFGGDCFGFDNSAERVFSAEAVSDVIVTRYSR